MRKARLLLGLPLLFVVACPSCFRRTCEEPVPVIRLMPNWVKYPSDTTRPQSSTEEDLHGSK